MYKSQQKGITSIKIHRNQNKNSKKFFVLVSQSLEYLVEESIQSVAKGAWAKERITWEFESDGHIESDALASVATEIQVDSDEIATEVRRTFIELARVFPDVSTVVQSSSSGMNPRLKVACNTP